MFDKPSIFNLFISIGFAFLDELSKVLWLQQTKHHTLESTAGDNSHCSVFEGGNGSVRESFSSFFCSFVVLNGLVSFLARYKSDQIWLLCLK